MTEKKQPLEGGWKKPQRRDPSPKMDRHAIDVVCTEQNHKITSIQVAFTDYLMQIIIYVTCVDPRGCLSSRGITKWCPSHMTSSQPWSPGRGQAPQDN